MNGFTLIELLVVVAVIGILSAFLFRILSPSIEKGRDSTRIHDIQQIQNALELYYRRHNRYPVSDNCNSASSPRPNADWCNTFQTMSADGHWIKDDGAENVLANFFSNDPVDPLFNTIVSDATLFGGTIDPAPGTYYYYSDGFGGPGQFYVLLFTLENGEAHPLRDVDGVYGCGTGAQRGPQNTAPDGGNWFHYGDNGTRSEVITIGANCKRGLQP